MTLEEIEVKAMHTVPERFKKSIMCPGTNIKANPLMCYICPPSNCAHKLGARSNLLWSYLRDPDQYPAWVDELVKTLENQVKWDGNDV